MKDTVKGITPEGDREHIISLYGHVKGIEREVEIIKTNHLAHLDQKISHVHEDVEKLGGKIDKIYMVVIGSVGAIGLLVIESLLGML
jgi:L-lactate utilization protein LutB